MKSINQSTKKTVKPINNSNNQSTKRAISQPNKQSINQTSNQLNVYLYTVYIYIYIVIYLHLYIYIHIWLVLSTPLKKYESQFGLLFPIYGIKFMFQTTNQTCIYGLFGTEEFGILGSLFADPTNIQWFGQTPSRCLTPCIYIYIYQPDFNGRTDMK